MEIHKLHIMGKLQPLQFSMELLEIGGIHNSGYGKIAGALPLQFSGELQETGGIHNSGYGKIAGLRPAIFSGTPENWGHP